MKTQLQLTPIWSFGRIWKTAVGVFALVMTVFSPLLSGAQTGYSGPCNDFNTSYSITYDPVTKKTTLLFNASLKNGVSASGKGISHFDFAFCADGQSAINFTQVIQSGNYVAEYSSDGQNWQTATTVYGPDGSATDCVGNTAVFKFNNGVGTATWYRLILDGQWAGTPDYLMVKYGNSCCISQLTEECFKILCIPPVCPTISASSSDDVFVGQSRTYSIPAQDADVTVTWSIVSPVGATPTAVANGNSYSVTFNQEGQYTIQVTLSKGPNCETICSKVVSVVPFPANFTIEATPYCSNDQTKGSVAVVGGGQNGVTYCLRASGSNTDIACLTKTSGGPNVVFTNLPAGDYDVYATTNPQGITLPNPQGASNNPVTVVENPAAGIQITKLNVTCNGQSNGSIDLTVTVPQGLNYQVQWKKDNVNYSTEEDLPGLAPGVYSVTVTTDAGCVSTASTTVSQPDPVSITATSTNVICNGANNGTITVTSVSPQNAVITISKDGGAPTAYDPLATYGPGSYVLTASIPNGNNNGFCTASTMALVITEPTAVVSVEASATNVSCNGAADGTITLTTLTPADATVTISKDGGAAVAYDPSAKYGPGNYVITATAPNGTGTGVCTDVANVSISEPPAVSIKASGTDVLCNGGSTGTITVTELLPNTATVTIKKGDGAYGAYDPNATYGAGVYTLMATIPGGNQGQTCSATTTVTIGEPSALNIQANAEPIACAGGTTTIVVTTSGGTTPYKQNPAGSYPNLGAGQYSYTLIDANDCEATTSVTLVNPAPFTCTVSGASEVCTDATTTYTVSVSGGTAAQYAWSVTGTYASYTENGNSITVVSAGEGSYTVSVQVTSSAGCVTSCTKQTLVVNCTVCTYTIGYYGNPGGKSCFEGDPNNTTQGVIRKAIDAAGFDGVAGSEVFGSVANNRYWTITAVDVYGAYWGNDAKKIATNNIFKMLPGGGNSQAFASYMGGGTYANKASWFVAPLDTKKATEGKIRNTLFAQTLALYVSLQNSNDLGGITLKDYVMTTRDVVCNTNQLVGEPMEYSLPASVVDFLKGNDGLGAGGTDKYAGTVKGLYDLANAYLGGETPGNLGATTVANAVDVINNAFDGCRAVTGWSSGSSMTAPITYAAPSVAPSINVANRNVDQAEVSLENGIVKTYPNPFVDRVTFIIQPKVSGQAQLDIYDMTGRKLQTPFNGYLRAGQKQTVEVKLNAQSNGTLIYRLNTGGQQATGKLLRLK